MSLPWVKLHASLIDNDVFKRLSKAAKLTFYTCLSLAGKCDQDGLLRVRTGAMTPAEIAHYTGLPEKQQREALSELIAADFLYSALDQSYGVQRWDEKAGDLSTLISNRERQRKHRESKKQANVTGNVTRNSGDVTSNVTGNALLVTQNVTDIDIDIERRSTDSLRSSAVGFREWPTTVDDLRGLAALFVEAFSNCVDPAKISDALPAYTAVLAQMRSRASIPEAWQSFADAHEANGGKPLFKSHAKSAMSFLQGRNSFSQARKLKVVSKAELENAI